MYLQLLLTAGLGAGPAAPSPPGVGALYDGAARDLDVETPYVESASIRIDGTLDESEWAEAAVLSGFTQYEPVEGAPATQATEVRVLVTGEAVYFGVVARDEGSIRATLAERDRYSRSDDYVRLLLDTYDDRRRAYVFQVNPLGVQADGVWVEGGRGGPIDWNPDLLWESAGRVSGDGYEVELRIPLKSLRFQDEPVQDWGLQVIRRIQRNGYEQSWAPLTRDRVNQLAQAGRLRGLAGLEPGLRLEVNPVLTGSRIGSWDAASSSVERAGRSDLGANVTLGLTPNLTLDGTYNPDFSHVEADAGRITVNERFAVRLAEKRPFFLEGTDVFSMPASLVYTRSIVNPVGAAKISGKVGRSSVAYLGAVDEAGDGRPMVNLLRVKRDLAGSSTVGLLYADRTLPGARFNRVLAADARAVFGGRYSLDVLAAGSADGSEGDPTRRGSLFVADFERSGRNTRLNASFQDVSSDFRARSGFIRRVGVTEAEIRTGYTWRGEPGALVESWGPRLEVEGTWDRDAFWRGGGPEESGVELSLFASLRGNLGGYLSWSRTRFDVPPGAYDGLVVVRDGAALGPFVPAPGRFSGLDALRARSWIRPWDGARLSLGFGRSETPIYDRFLGLPAELGEAISADADVTLDLTGSLQAELGARHAVITRQRDGSTYSTATVPRAQARYQFSRSLFVRATGEYAFQERGAVRDPATGEALGRCGDDGCALQAGSDRYDFSVEGLVGYEPSPGTVFYLGYSRQMRDALGFRFRDLSTRADGLFVKLSYRARL